MAEDHCADLIDHSHVPDFEVQLAVKIALTVLYGIILLAGIIGNSVTIQTTKLLRDKGYLQKGVTDHMISLACSDLLVILLGMPVELYSMIWFPFSSTYGNITCKIYCFLFEACSYATIFHVATLSFERYMAICHPFRFKLVSGTRAVKLMLCFAWLTSVCVALPLIFAMGAEYPLSPVFGRRSECNVSTSYHLTANITLCTNLHSKWTAFQASIFSAFVVYIVVLVSVAFMCRKMMVILMVAKKGTLTVKGPPGTVQTNEMTKSNNPEAKSARKQTIIFLESITSPHHPEDVTSCRVMRWGCPRPAHSTKTTNEAARITRRLRVSHSPGDVNSYHPLDLLLVIASAVRCDAPRRNPAWCIASNCGCEQQRGRDSGGI
uniref:G-protein coupled receptors family 1 profile domain-containing protein n=1 Tax=Pyxicephalus adspersus TaxID=30357 RepID=A0AAV3A5J3_PYXAD|nr:TPA: hypothetical protein GDO54_016008 [Pyxicephalus adspersus]